MRLTDVVLAPLHAARLTVRAAEDLNAIAERARRSPDPVEEVRERIDLVLLELQGLIAEARRVRLVGEEIVAGGRDLTATAKSLDAHTVEIITGGEDLTAQAVRLTGEAARLNREAARLEDSVETVAETVEPLQGAAERVGRVTKRLSRDKPARPARPRVVRPSTQD